MLFEMQLNKNVNSKGPDVKYEDHFADNIRGTGLRFENIEGENKVGFVRK